jgi:hypothetical protein
MGTSQIRRIHGIQYKTNKIVVFDPVTQVAG